MINHLKIRVLYAVCFLVVSVVSANCFPIGVLSLGTSTNRLCARNGPQLCRDSMLGVFVHVCVPCCPMACWVCLCMLACSPSCRPESGVFTGGLGLCCLFSYSVSC